MPECGFSSTASYDLFCVKCSIFPSAFILELCYGAAYPLIVYKCCPSLPVLMMLSGTVLTIFPLFFQKRFAALPAGRLPYKGSFVLQILQTSSPLSSTTSWHTGHLFGYKSPIKVFFYSHPSTSLIRSYSPTVPGLLAGIVDHLCKRLRTSHQCHTRACSCNCCIQKISVHKHPRPVSSGITTAGYSLPWDLWIVHRIGKLQFFQHLEAVVTVR